MNLNNLSNDFTSHINDIFTKDFLQSLEKFLANDRREINMIETVTIDRIEETYAVCELSDKTMLNVPLEKFNFEINETDIVKLNITYEDGKISDITVISKDDNEKLSRQKSIEDKFNFLKNKN